MKKKICLFVILLISSLLNAQNIRYKTVQTANYYLNNNKLFHFNKGEIIECNKEIYYVTYDYNNYNFDLFFEGKYNNEIVYMYGNNSEIELIDSIKLFTEKFNCFIPVYYLDVLKTKNRKVIFNKEPQWNYFKDEYATFEGESFYDTFILKKLF